MLLLLLHGGGFAELRTQQRRQLHACGWPQAFPLHFHFQLHVHVHLLLPLPLPLPLLGCESARLVVWAVLRCSGALVRFSSGIANPDKPIFPNGVRAGPLAVLACPALGRWQAAPAGVAPSSCRTRRGWGEELQGLSLNLGDLN